MLVRETASQVKSSLAWAFLYAYRVHPSTHEKLTTLKWNKPSEFVEFSIHLRCDWATIENLKKFSPQPPHAISHSFTSRLMLKITNISTDIVVVSKVIIFLTFPALTRDFSPMLFSPLFAVQHNGLPGEMWIKREISTNCWYYAIYTRTCEMMEM